MSKNKNNPVSSTTVVAVKENVIERGLSTQERDNTPIQTGTKEEGDLDKKSSQIEAEISRSGTYQNKEEKVTNSEEIEDL